MNNITLFDGTSDNTERKNDKLDKISQLLKNQNSNYAQDYFKDSVYFHKSGPVSKNVENERDSEA